MDPEVGKGPSTQASLCNTESSCDIAVRRWVCQPFSRAWAKHGQVENFLHSTYEYCAIPCHCQIDVNMRKL